MPLAKEYSYCKKFERLMMLTLFIGGASALIIFLVSKNIIISQAILFSVFALMGIFFYMDKKSYYLVDLKRRKKARESGDVVQARVILFSIGRQYSFVKVYCETSEGAVVYDDRFLK